MCDCLKEMKDKIKNEIPQKNKEYSKLEIESVGCDNEIIYMTGDSKCKLFIPFTIEHQKIGRKTKTTISMLAKFCPFCGVPYDN